jgi:eukaryotic-like serine/threonine-protein kinase
MAVVIVDRCMVASGGAELVGTGDAEYLLGRLSGMDDDASTLPAEPGAPGSAAAVSSPAVSELPRGAMLGRYLVLDRIGAGAMGIVYAAFDPKLDRKLAIKLLHVDGDAPEQGRRRLLREAQALARLHHPNVVAVHDVGLHDGAIFVAMEFVAGTSMRAWMDARGDRLAWRDVVAVFRQAAEGLAAAHEVGLVHRDFKPDNAMIDPQGRVRVLDFGLARTAADAHVDEPLEPHAPATAGSLGVAHTVDERVLAAVLTRRGALVGTPAYMSPEQLRGEALDARSDQFSFCIALFEALYGTRPFHGDTLPALMVDIIGGKPDVPAARGVPRWLQRLVMRGLAPAPGDRHPDLATVARELATASSRRRRIAAAVVVAAGMAATIALARMTPDTACSGAELALATVWDGPRREAIVAQLSATELPYAAATAVRVTSILDDYAANWVTMHEQACQATHARQEQSSELLDRRMACLDQRRAALEALVELLLAADAELVEHAVEAAQHLPLVDDCGDLERLLSDAPPPSDPAARAIFDGSRLALARAAAAAAAARFEVGLAAADEALIAARTIEHGPLVAEAEVVRARLLEGVGRRVEAADALREADHHARAAGDDRHAAEAEIDAVYVIGYRLARFEEGGWWAEHALGAVEHLGDETLAARLDNNRGVLLYAAGDHERALEYFGRALASRERLLGDENLDVAESHYNLAIAMRSAGRIGEARTHHERALVLRERLLGTDHPRVAESRSALAVVDQDEGRSDQAIAGWRAAERIQRAAYGPRHPKLGGTLINLGNAEAERGDLAAAEAYLREALAILAAGDDELKTDRTVQNLGEVLLRRGDRLGARDVLQRSLPGRIRRLGPEHPDVARTLVKLGRVRVELGDREGARADLERAVLIFEQHDDEALALARARLALATALDDDEPRALELGRLARATFAAKGDAGAEGLRDADAWLERVGG